MKIKLSKKQKAQLKALVEMASLGALVPTSWVDRIVPGLYQQLEAEIKQK